MGANQAGGRQAEVPFSFLERFIAQNFKRMPRVVQVFVYLLFAIVIANGAITPIYVEGQIWIKKKPAPEYGDSFVVTFEGSRYVANKYGLVLVKTTTKVPGRLRFDLETNDGKPLKPVYIPVPLPVYSALKPPFVDITYEPDMGSVNVGAP